MRFERIWERGSGIRFQLLDGTREIGYIRGGVVGFGGFDTREEAVEAASLAHRGLEQRRAMQAPTTGTPEELLVWDRDDGTHVVARTGLVARLTPPGTVGGPEGWGFEIRLLPEEREAVFAMSRARTMWRALRATLQVAR